MNRSDIRWPGRQTSSWIAIAMFLALPACALEPLSSSEVTTSSTQGADARGVATPPVPGESLEARLARLENDLAELKLDYSVVRPDFERLVDRETDLSRRVEALEVVSGPLTASVPAAAHRATPAKPAAAVASDEIGLHLASYRSRDRLLEGWNELRAAHPAELGALTVRVQRIDTGNGGVFQRLMAGPVVSRTQADGLCRTLAARGVYCRALPFKGHSL